MALYVKSHQHMLQAYAVECETTRGLDMKASSSCPEHHYRSDEFKNSQSDSPFLQSLRQRRISVATIFRFVMTFINAVVLPCQCIDSWVFCLHISSPLIHKSLRELPQASIVHKDRLNVGRERAE